jgi:hypothetical protein
MDSSPETAELPADGPAMEATNGPFLAKGNGRGKVRLLTKENLDGRTKARKRFDATVDGIASDLGGEDHLTTVQKHLVEAFAGCAVVVHDINARLLLGQRIDIGEAAQAVSSLVRLASRIGVGRHLRDVTDLTDHIAEIETRAATAEAPS